MKNLCIKLDDRNKGHSGHHDNDGGLRSGPKNPQHKTFLHNAMLIQEALCSRIAKRDHCIKVSDLCSDAGISSPTFYLHYRNSNHAMQSYEEDMKQKFFNLLPMHTRREYILAILLDFISSNQNYFVSAVCGKDCYLLSEILNYYRISLVGDNISDKIFTIYGCLVQVVIAVWLEYDQITPESTKSCLNHILSIDVDKISKHWADFC